MIKLDLGHPSITKPKHDDRMTTHSDRYLQWHEVLTHDFTQGVIIHRVSNFMTDDVSMTEVHI